MALIIAGSMGLLISCINCSSCSDCTLPSEKAASFLNGIFLKMAAKKSSSAADVRAILPLEVTTGTLPPPVFTVDDVIGDIASDPRGLAVVDFMLIQAGRRPLSGAAENDFFAAIFKNMPFKKLAAFSEGKVQSEQLEQFMQLINSPMDPAMISAMLQQGVSAGEGE